MPAPHSTGNNPAVSSAISAARQKALDAITARFGTAGSNEIARHEAISDLLTKYGDTYGEMSLLAAAASAQERQNMVEYKRLMGMVTLTSVRPEPGPDGVLVDPLKEAAKTTEEFVDPYMGPTARIARWNSDNKRLDFGRCMVRCGTQVVDSFAMASSGGAYGLRMSWQIKGVCLPAFKNPVHALSVFRGLVKRTARVQAAQDLALLRHVVNATTEHRLTLAASNGAHLTNSSFNAPAKRGLYRHRQETFAPAPTPMSLVALDRHVLAEISQHYRQLGRQGFTIGGAVQNPNAPGDVHTIIDGQPFGGWPMVNLGMNANYVDPLQHFQKTGMLTSPFASAEGYNKAIPNFLFEQSTLFPGLAIDVASGSLVEIPAYVSSDTIPQDDRDGLGLTVGAAPVLNPAARNPYAVRFYIGVNPTMANIITVEDQFGYHLVSEDQFNGGAEASEYARMIGSVEGYAIARPRKEGELFTIHDHYFERNAVVVPNVNNGVVAVLARAQLLADTGVNDCNLAPVVMQNVEVLPDDCPRSPDHGGFVSHAITGAAVGGKSLLVTSSRPVGNTGRAHVLTITHRAGTNFSVYTTAYVDAAAVTLEVTDINGLNTLRVPATISRGFAFSDEHRDNIPTGGNLTVVVDTALAPGQIIRAISPQDVAGTGGVNVVRGSAEAYVDQTGASPAGHYVVQVDEMPTAAQWAVGSNRTLTVYNASGAPLQVIPQVELVALVNTDDGVASRIVINNAALTAEILSATRVTLA
jgi:hypothetical protein